MSENRNCFTFIWKIKNFSLGLDFIVSPYFFVHEMGGSRWRLVIYINRVTLEDHICCSIERKIGDCVPDEIDYELSFLNSDGSVPHSGMYCGRIDKKQPDLPRSLFSKKNRVRMKDLLIPDDALTIRCRMWNSQGSISDLGSCFAETRIEPHLQYVVGTIEKFSTIEPWGKYTVRHVKSSSTEKLLSYISLCVAADGVLGIEIKTITRDIKEIYYKCKIFVLDKFGNKANCGQGVVCDGRPHCISLGFSKEFLIEKEEHFLPNDELTIRCEMTTNLPAMCECIHEIEYFLNCKDTHTMIWNTKSEEMSSEKYSTENLTTLKDDWISVFKEGTLCDSKLKTATETFPVHKVVLSARSSVFKSMFTTDMREKRNNCIEIDDIDADTVRRMLLFMYSDTLDDLEYESAKSLYSAADKYNIVSLRQRCSNFLKQNLLPSNCCDILAFADRHQDESLKSAAQYCVSKNDEAVLSSEEWKYLEKNHSQLAIEVFRFIYMRNRRK